MVDPEDGLEHIDGLKEWPVETRLLGKPPPSAGEEGAEGEGGASEAEDVEAGRREAKGLAAFEAAWSGIDEALERINEFPLREEEIVGARLYTGPMFTKYNGAPLCFRAHIPNCASSADRVYATRLRVVQPACAGSACQRSSHASMSSASATATPRRCT